MDKKRVFLCLGFMFLLVALTVTPAYAITLRGIIDELTNAAKNVVQGLIFLSFIVGLGLYVIPFGPWEEWSARGKALMVRACTAQVIYSLSALIFTWLASLG